jgi:hypothetical protein
MNLHENHQIDQHASKIFNPQTKTTYCFITKQIQTPIKISQIHQHDHAIGLKSHNQTSVKTKNHAFSASLNNKLLTKTNVITQILILFILTL